MKEISELNFPDDLQYSDDHEWAKQTDGVARIGISDYAQNQLGDIVEFGTVESVKAVSELYMPVGGEITAVNEALEDEPELVNNNPYDGGWMVEVKLTDPAEFEALKNKEAYLEMLKG